MEIIIFIAINIIVTRAKIISFTINWLKLNLAFITYFLSASTLYCEPFLT